MNHNLYCRVFANLGCWSVGPSVILCLSWHRQGIRATYIFNWNLNTINVSIRHHLEPFYFNTLTFWKNAPFLAHVACVVFASWETASCMIPWTARGVIFKRWCLRQIWKPMSLRLLLRWRQNGFVRCGVGEIEAEVAPFHGQSWVFPRCSDYLFYLSVILYRYVASSALLPLVNTFFLLSYVNEW